MCLNKELTIFLECDFHICTTVLSLFLFFLWEFNKLEVKVSKSKGILPINFLLSFFIILACISNKTLPCLLLKNNEEFTLNCVLASKHQFRWGRRWEDWKYLSVPSSLVEFQEEERGWTGKNILYLINNKLFFEDLIKFKNKKK